MDLLIMSLSKAVEYIPAQKTYAIRIYSGNPQSNLSANSLRLQPSENWIHIGEYNFDDIFPYNSSQFPKYVLFNEEIAKKILREFSEYRQDSKNLLVHCSQGLNRAPAIGIALNEIFELGHDSKSLKEKYPHTNWFIYSTLIKTAKDRYSKDKTL